MIAYQNILQAALSLSYRAVPSSDGLRDGVWLGWKLEMLGHNVRLPLSLCEAVYQTPKKRYGRCRKQPWRLHCIMPLRFAAMKTEDQHAAPCYFGRRRCLPASALR